ncbi:MAG: hypothetical protein ACLP7O_06690 [Terracidiphilus sp.]
MNQSDLECLKANVDQIVEIETRKGEHLLIKVLYVFDQESDPDVFFYDVTSDPLKQDSEQSEGYGLPLQEIVSVRKYQIKGGRA